MSLFWKREDLGQTLAELSDSKDHETEEQICRGYCDLSSARTENQVSLNIC